MPIYYDPDYGLPEGVPMLLSEPLTGPMAGLSRNERRRRARAERANNENEQQPPAAAENQEAAPKGKKKTKRKGKGSASNASEADPKGVAGTSAVVDGHGVVGASASTEKVRKAGPVGNLVMGLFYLMSLLILLDYAAWGITAVGDRYNVPGKDVWAPAKLVHGLEAYAKLAVEASELSFVPAQVEALDNIIDTYAETSYVPRHRPGLPNPGWHGHNETARLRDIGRTTIGKIMGIWEDSNKQGLPRMIYGRADPSDAVKAAAVELKQLRDQTDRLLHTDIPALHSYIDAEHEYINEYVDHMNAASLRWNQTALDLQRGPNFKRRKIIADGLRFISRRVVEAQNSCMGLVKGVPGGKKIVLPEPAKETKISRYLSSLADSIEANNPTPSPKLAKQIRYLRGRGFNSADLAADLGGDSAIHKARNMTINFAARLEAWREEYQNVVPTAQTNIPKDPQPYSIWAFELALRPLVKTLSHRGMWPMCPEKDAACKIDKYVEQNFGLPERFNWDRKQWRAQRIYEIHKKKEYWFNLKYNLRQSLGLW